MWVRLIHFAIQSALTTGKSSVKGNSSKITAELLVKRSNKLGKIAIFIKV